MLDYGPEQASRLPLTPENARIIVARARQAIILRIPLSLASAGVFLILAMRGQGIVVMVWHFFFALSLVAVGLSVFSFIRHVQTLRRLPGDLEKAIALGIPARRFWEEHAGLFPFRLSGGSKNE